MNAREFFETVRRMREKQELYFRTRSTQAPCKKARSLREWWTAKSRGSMP